MSDLTILFPAYQGSNPFVFVCYAHADNEAVSAELWSAHELGLNILVSGLLARNSPDPALKKLANHLEMERQPSDSFGAD